MRLIPAATLALLALSCSKPTPPARALKVPTRADLIGGRRALGEVGDFKLSNGIIHAVIQDVGTSRGFGAFGGSLIDIDLVRATKASNTQGPVGNDYFTEMFPAFFLMAIEPKKVEVLADGSDGGAAIVRVSGEGGEFISVVKAINDLLFPSSKLAYTVDYILEPGKQYLKVVTTVKNVDAYDATFSGIPFGFVTLLGEGQRLFLPNEAGFDVRFHLEEVFKRPSKLPDALPGEVVSMLATEGQGVSYAVAASPLRAGYMAGSKEYYQPYGWRPDSMLIPIASSSFLGTFWGKPPDVLPPNKEYSFTGYVAVGTGDVASAQKVVYEINDTATEKQRTPTPYGTISGRIRELLSGAPLTGISVVLQDEQGRYKSQARTIAGGIYTAPVPPGKYRAFAVENSRDVAVSPDYVEVAAEGVAQIDLDMTAPAFLQVTVRDDQGAAIPAKVSVEGEYAHTGIEVPRQFLYNLAVGEKFRNTDLLPDTDARDSRRYLERVFYAPKGAAGRALRPGKYRVFASRGIEYSLESQDVELVANKTTTVALTLKHEFTTPGWASGDFHVHSANSVDSDMSLDERVTSYAVEGVDLVVSTDHNYVSDFRPTIDALGLSDWLQSAVGLELTTLEMGHFNGFPVKVDPGPVSHGSFAWFRRPPGELFAQLRGLGADPANTLVQVNHPRDSILGYFTAFNIGTYTLEPYKGGGFSIDSSNLPDGTPGPYSPERFSLDFDALEVFNAKRDMLLFSYRVPEGGVVGPEPTAFPPCPTGQRADCVPAPGQMTLVTQTTLDGGSIETPAFPGALDDWYSILAHGHHVTGMGNSDSHGGSAEAGLPRTYMNVGATADGSMRGLSEAACMSAVKNGKAIVTNGPFIEAWVNGKEIGDTVVAPTGEIEVKVKVQAASWVDLKKVEVMRGGPDAVVPQLLATLDVAKGTDVLRVPEQVLFKGTIPDRSYIVVVASGTEQMWPVHTPYEMASFQISDAVSAVAGSLANNFGPAKWGKYQPEPTNTVRPYGFTNPIWVSYTAQQALRAPRKVLPVGASQSFSPRAMGDLRKLFGAFHSDP